MERPTDSSFLVCGGPEYTAARRAKGAHRKPEQTKAFIDALRVLNPILDYASLDQVAGPVQIICRDYRLTP